MTKNTGYFKVDTPKIKLRTPQYIYMRLLLLYTFLYTLAFALGCLLFHFVDKSRTICGIAKYFSTDIGEFTDIFSFCERLLSLSRRDLADLFFIFAAGFTMLAGLAVSLLLIFRGFSLGFLIGCLTYMIRSGELQHTHPTAAVLAFSVLCALGAAVFLHMAVKTTLFSDDFKALCGRPSKIIRSKALYTHIFRFLIAFGSFLILNLIRCII